MHAICKKPCKVSFYLFIFYLLLFSNYSTANGGISIPSSSSTGSYRITYSSGGADHTFLQEKSGSTGTWKNVADDGNDGIVDFQGKTDGTYYYRILHLNFDSPHPGPNFNYSKTYTLVVQSGPTPRAGSFKDQMLYKYEVRKGDVNSDGLQDLYIKRISGGNPDDGVLYEGIIQQKTDKTFLALTATISQLSVGRNWPKIAVDVDFVDLNVDWHVDLVIRNLSSHIAGIDEQIVFSSGKAYQRGPKHVRAIDDKLKSFSEQLKGWIQDRSYFDQLKTVETYYTRINVGPLRPTFNGWSEFNSFTANRCGFACHIDGQSIPSGGGLGYVFPDYVSLSFPFDVVTYLPGVNFQASGAAKTLEDVIAENKKSPRIKPNRGWGGLLGILYELLDIDVPEVPTLPPLEIPPKNYPILDKGALESVRILIELECTNNPDACEEALEGILNDPDIIVAEDHNHDRNDIDFWVDLIPGLASVVERKRNDPNRSWCTYIKRHPDGRVYYGRTSGKQGVGCVQAVKNRDSGHPYTKLGFGAAVLDRQAQGIQGRLAIRGREQQLIDSHVYTDGVSEGLASLRVANRIRGVAKANPEGCVYWLASTAMFPPPIGPYTGFRNGISCGSVP